jgi:hypothetical protein
MMAMFSAPVPDGVLVGVTVPERHMQTTDENVNNLGMSWLDDLHHLMLLDPNRSCGPYLLVLWFLPKDTWTMDLAMRTNLAMILPLRLRITLPCL